MTEVPTPPSHANGFLFADLRDYTRFVESRGDHAAAALLAAYRGLVRDEVARYQGAEIRTEGDSFYVVFPSASAAIRCGLAILTAADAAAEADPSQPIRVGIGVHAGETAETSEGLVGSAVNIAARVCSQAKAGELLVTDIVRGLTRTSSPFPFLPLGRRRLKGITEPIALYRVVADGVPSSKPVRILPVRGFASRFVALVVSGLVIVAIVVSGIVVAAALGLPGAAPRPAPGSGAASGSATVEPSVAESTFPSTAEIDLLSRLPTSVYQEGQTNCRRALADEAAIGSRVSVHCDLPITADAKSVTYDQFPGASVMDTAFLGLEDRYRLSKGDCSRQPAAWMHWELPGSFSGTVLCYQDTVGHSWTTWTYDGSYILARGTREDANWKKLYGWWALTSALMLH